MTRIFEVSPYYISPVILGLAGPFFLLFILLLLLPKLKRQQLRECIKAFARPLILWAFFLAVSICCHIGQFNLVYVAYQNGEYNEVCGVIEKLNRESTKEHTWFTVNGVYFYFYDNGWAGHPPFELAKTFYNGMPVRIGYVEISKKHREIVFIDLLDEVPVIG